MPEPEGIRPGAWGTEWEDGVQDSEQGDQAWGRPSLLVDPEHLQCAGWIYGQLQVPVGVGGMPV
jgi:hypothetical protein